MSTLGQENVAVRRDCGTLQRAEVNCGVGMIRLLKNRNHQRGWHRAVSRSLGWQKSIASGKQSRGDVRSQAGGREIFS